MLIHLSPFDIPGDEILPPTETGRYGCKMANEQVRENFTRLRQYRDDLVYLMCVDDPGQLGPTTFAGDNPYIYEVAPNGDSITDPDMTALPGHKAYRSAKIVRRLGRLHPDRSSTNCP